MPREKNGPTWFESIMPERFADYPEREAEEEIIRDTESALGLDSGLSPGQYSKKFEGQLFSEDPQTPEQRKCADCFVGYLLPSIRNRTELSTPQDIKKTYESRREVWELSEDEPFVDFSLTHLLGAVKRRIAWFQELKLYEEADLWNEDIRACHELQNLIEQTLGLDSGFAPTEKSFK